MAHTNKSLLSSGATSFGVSKRYVIWLYVVGLVLGIGSSAGLFARLGDVLDRSLYSDRLMHGFDLATFMGLIEKPEVSLGSHTLISLLCAAVFFFFEIFLAGGILAEYLADARMERTQFYSRCGENFWKLIRIAILFFIAAAIVMGIVRGIRFGIGSATENWKNEQAAFALQCIVVVLEGLALLWLRMWFDLAQTETVSTSARRVRSAVGHGFRSACRAGALYASYLLLGIVALAVLVLGGWFWWSVVPAAATVLSFVVWQVILFVTLALRWWQRAVVVAWYERSIPVTEPVVLHAEPLPQTPAPLPEMNS
ncbi:MAG TPA: hypothetical protein VFQ00_10965 [Terriglobales bacterium]|nr:hypothetical protein [Terriglobales bacterium]